MNLPIDITNQNPDTFSYSPSELGLTPVTTNTEIRIPLMTPWRGYEEDLAPVGSTPQRSIWIGKNASLTLLTGTSYTTHRHEIASLAFEDGRTDLLTNISIATVDSQNSDYWEDGSQAPGPFQDDNGNFLYDTQTISDAESPAQSLTQWYGWPCNDITITKSLRLPEGITGFGKFVFAHTNFDKSGPQDYDLHTPQKLHIMIPSTVTSFKISGIVTDNSAEYYGTPYWSEDATAQLSSNILYFGMLTNEREYALWRGGAEDDYYPSEAEELPDFLEEYPPDEVHIYLRNHTEVPTIEFIGRIYFPIVFHVNVGIERAFRETYAGTVEFKPGSYYPNYDARDFDPLTIVGDFGLAEETQSMGSLGEVAFSPVALSGSYGDLKNNPIPDAPTTDGNYVLKVTVSSGEPTYTWVASQS